MKKICPKCETEKDLETEFYKNKSRMNSYSGYCKKCHAKVVYQSVSKDPTALRKAKLKWRQSNPVRNIAMGAKARSKKLGLAFDEDYSDIVIPTHCPILGIPLFVSGKATPNSPSLDRIIPSLGYVKGNRQVISHKANMMKQDATFEELVLLGKWAQGEIDRRG